MAWEPDPRWQGPPLLVLLWDSGSEWCCGKKREKKAGFGTLEIKSVNASDHFRFSVFGIPESPPKKKSPINMSTPESFPEVTRRFGRARWRCGGFRWITWECCGSENVVRTPLDPVQRKPPESGCRVHRVTHFPSNWLTSHYLYSYVKIRSNLSDCFILLTHQSKSFTGRMLDIYTLYKP